MRSAETSGDAEPTANTALIDGVRRFAMDVRELDIDLIDRINPFGEAYAILAKTMSEDSLKQVAAAIAAKRTSLTPEEAKELAVRAVQVQEGARAAPVARLAGCLGAAHGRRGRRLRALQEGGSL